MGKISDSAEKDYVFNFVFSAFDVTDPEKVKKFVYSTSKTFDGRLCGLVHCAGEVLPPHICEEPDNRIKLGINPSCPTVDTVSLDLFDKIINVNLKSTFLLDQAVIQVCKSQGAENAPPGGYSIVVSVLCYSYNRTNYCQNMGSVSGNLGQANFSAYCASSR